MIFGLTNGHIKLAKKFLASRNDNLDYQKALDDFEGLLLTFLEENIGRVLEND
ncbi:hypothetical protein [Streptococcus sp. sy004]|uniref:hypothetical protein n=1 Tax=Streptococcus sp. sy004 TaxID=2600149 RepID=UPI0016454507|nr:hypothetical protein [Streptococcus sp. sy004]